MPYYSWTGISLHGVIKKGTTYAQSPDALDALLFKKDIASLHIKPSRMLRIRKKITAQAYSAFFNQLAQLLRAGILLPEALVIVQASMQSELQPIIQNIIDAVQKGCSLAQALQHHPKIFDPFVVQMVHVGHESGTLPLSLSLLAEHIEMMRGFTKQLKSAAYTPLLTALFFMLVACFVVIFIVPQFAALFASFSQELPPITRQLIAFSAFVDSWRMAVVGALCAILFLIIRDYATSAHGKGVMRSLYARMPIIGFCMQQSALLYFFRSVAMLLKAGIALPKALSIVRHAMANQSLESHILFLEQEVESGISLSAAMEQNHEQLFDQHVVAMIKVGEESGQLHDMLLQAAHVHHEKVQQTLKMATLVFQPLLMVIMGLLVTLLVFAVYLPVLQFSQVIR
jgi:type IV pilus assembly protein PilC